MKTIDMHFHTKASDGRNTSEEVLARIQDQDGGIYVLTDHDVISREFARALKDMGMESYEGVEISARNYDTSKSLHLTCYANRFEDEVFDLVSGIRAGRQGKIRAQLKKLQTHGFQIDIDDFYRFFQEKGMNTENLNVYHVSVYILKNPFNRELVKKFRSDARDIPFAQYDSLEQERVGFLKDFLRDSGDFAHIGTQEVDDYEPAVELCGEIARKHAGILSLAHPVFTFARNGVTGFVDRFPNYYDKGVNAIEINVKSTKKWIEATLELQRRYGVLITFGSDCHNIDRPDDKHGLIGQINAILDSDFVAEQTKRIQKKLG